MVVGLRFTRVVEREPDGPVVRPLRRVRKQGVEELGTWIFERHLERSRQKGLT